MADPPPSFPASAGPIPRSPPRHATPSPEPQRSPPHNKPRKLRAQPYPKAESLTLLPHPTPSRRQRDRSGASIGSDPQKTLRAAQWPILPRASLRAQDRPRGAPHGMPPHRQNHSAALPTTNRENSERTRIQRLKASPSSHTIRPAGGSGIDPKQALEAIHKNPARSAKADPPPSFPASAGPFPRSPSRNTFLVKSVPFCVDMRD